MSIAQPLNTLISQFRSRLPSTLREVIPVGDQHLKAAFDLAFFLQPDRKIASSITALALSQVEAVFSAQFNRKCYSPVGHSHNLAIRTKVLMSRLQLLQRLVYSQSEPFELEQERDSASWVDEEDMLIRFVKHLVRITVRRNSFYVTVGISRLLHSYTTDQTMHIYNLIVQDPDRVKDDSYYRSRKAELMRDLLKRFGSLVSKVRVARGEERLEAEERSERQIDLVRRSLERFTPWGTECVLPDRFDPGFDELAELAFNGDNPDKEHPIEMSRMHSLIDPDCFSRITEALRYESPDERLTIPRFNVAKRGGQGKNRRADRFNPPELSQEEIEAIWKEVEELKLRGKRVSPKVLKVKVDCDEAGRLEAGKESLLKFEVSKWAEMIRVCAEDEKGEVAIAVYLLNCSEEVEEGETEEWRLELEGGARIRIELRMRSDGYGEYDGAEVEVGYEGKSEAEAARGYLKEVGYERGPFIKRTNGREEPSNGIMCRRFAFGEMSRNKTARDNLDFISFSSESVLSDRLRVSLARFYQHSSLRIITKQSLLDHGRRLVSLAEDARLLRQTEALEEISEKLTLFPLQQIKIIGAHYKALCLKLVGRTEEARALFEKVAGSVPPSYRAKTIHSLGATYLDKGDLVSAHKLFTEASQLACRKGYTNPVAFLQSQWWLGILQSIDGDHESSLARFEGLRPLVEIAASRYPSLWFQYQNGLAVELMELGRMQEAQHASQIAVCSPFAHIDPEWRETARDIAIKTRRASHSVVAISSPSESDSLVNSPVEASSASGPGCRQPSAKKLSALSDSLPAEIASRRELRDLSPDQKLSFIAKMVKELGLCEEKSDSSIDGLADTPSGGPNPPKRPAQIDLESESDLEKIFVLWFGGQITTEVFAAVFQRLDDCKDFHRSDAIASCMLRYTFIESSEFAKSKLKWQEKVRGQIDVESEPDLEKSVRLWFTGGFRPERFGPVIMGLITCKDAARRSEIINHMVHYAFLETVGNEQQSEEEWRRKVKELVKPIADTNA